MQTFKIIFSKQADADIWLIQVTKPQFNKWHRTTCQANLLGLDQEPLNRANFHQFIPAVLLACGKKACWITHGWLNNTGLTRNGLARKLHYLVLGNYRHSSARDSIHTKNILIWTRRTNFDIICRRFPKILIIEINECRLWNP